MNSTITFTNSQSILMNFKIASCLVESGPVVSYPHGNLTTRGTVNHFDNKKIGTYDPVKVANISVRNENGIAFFESKELRVSALRAIAAGLIEIADKAELAAASMNELNVDK